MVKGLKMQVENQIIVIGHVNPDTDAIASAMGYAWLLREARRHQCRRRSVWRH